MAQAGRLRNKKLFYDILKDLRDEEFGEFKWFLEDYGVPKSDLEKADRMETVDTITQTFNLKSAEVIKEILKEIPRNDLAERLPNSTGRPEPTSSSQRKDDIKMPCQDTKEIQASQPSGQQLFQTSLNHKQKSSANSAWTSLWSVERVMTNSPAHSEVFPVGTIGTRGTRVSSVKESLRKRSTRLTWASPSVYKLLLKKVYMNIAGCQRFSFGEESLRQNRTIMLLGATGSGKSTLINGMINYILGVNWEDDFRFKLIEEESRSQADSQTSEVTVYKINHQEGFRVPFSLTIIDTPEFADTRGIDRDRQITEYLRNLFSSMSGVTEIDVVCFVVQSSLAQLTLTQKYVFDSLLSIFGKDITENIRILVTFADGQLPPVLEAIKAADVPCPKTEDGLPVHFKFNNSVIFAEKTSAAGRKARNFDEMFWDMGAEFMEMFFEAFELMKTKSLTLTQEVLSERRQLENSIEKLQGKVKVGLDKLEEIKETAEKLKEHEAEMNRNKDFEFEVTIIKPFKEDISGTGRFVTNCQQCNYTCDDDCDYANDSDKYKCSAFGSDGYCRVCPGKCIWSEHSNMKYRWVYKEVKEIRIVSELKQKYDIAKEAKSAVEALIRKLKAEYYEVQTKVEQLMDQSTKCLKRLKMIALKPDPLSTPEYIDMLIEAEKSEGKPGWWNRVESLTDMKQSAIYMDKVNRGEKVL